MSLTSHHIAICRQAVKKLPTFAGSFSFKSAKKSAVDEGKPIVDLLSNLKKKETEKVFSRIVCVYAGCIVRLPWSWPNRLPNNLTRRPFQNQKSSFCG